MFTTAADDALSFLNSCSRDDIVRVLSEVSSGESARFRFSPTQEWLAVVRPCPHSLSALKRVRAACGGASRYPCALAAAAQHVRAGSSDHPEPTSHHSEPATYLAQVRIAPVQR